MRSCPCITSILWPRIEFFEIVSRELLPKSDIVESQLATSLEGRDESVNKRRNHVGIVPADRRLIQFGAARMNK